MFVWVKSVASLHTTSSVQIGWLYKVHFLT